MTLDKITSPALAPLDHGFFGREGGLSCGVYTGLNCGLGSKDDQSTVLENRARVASALALPANALHGVHQIHSADVAYIDASTPTSLHADAMVTDQKGIALGILTADCQPVLYADPEAGIIGAAHAGWKGAIGGVLENTVEEMIKLGARREAIRAVIGPCISQEAYEVSESFRDTFLKENADFARFFIAGNAEGKFQFDLPSFGLSRLESAKIGHAEWVGLCTYADAARFYSYRRTTHLQEPDYGRLIAAIRL